MDWRSIEVRRHPSGSVGWLAGWLAGCDLRVTRENGTDVLMVFSQGDPGLLELEDRHGRICPASPPQELPAQSHRGRGSHLQGDPEPAPGKRSAVGLPAPAVRMSDAPSTGTTRFPTETAGHAAYYLTVGRCDALALGGVAAVITRREEWRARLRPWLSGITWATGGILVGPVLLLRGLDA
jgi:hypothetical protein